MALFLMGAVSLYSITEPDSAIAMEPSAETWFVVAPALVAAVMILARVGASFLSAMLTA